MSESLVYIVNVWRSTGALRLFRATARTVTEAEPHAFTSAADLARYLADAACEPASPPASVGTSTSGDSPPSEESTR